MKKLSTAVALAALFAGAPAWAGAFTLSSHDIAEGRPIAEKYVFSGFGCTGQNVSPDLEWSGAPAGTKSFALTVYDPDAPTGSGWWHWLVVNIPPATTRLDEGAGDPAKGLMPAGAVQSRTDFGTVGYGGPCPPKGNAPHHYIFTIHALDVASLPLDSQTSAAMVGFMLHAHDIGKASLTATYGR
ncbi:MAG: YbhB/YbcL family Raf kinase inhibitor-like protein [Magnetospirillum sp.]|nr:YbhB/YbcL family Raf kinase inhibitor-like protein [Magnetospirillum sp.]